MPIKLRTKARQVAPQEQKATPAHLAAALQMFDYGTAQTRVTRGGGQVNRRCAKGKGQEVVLKDGYLPLPADIVKQEIAKIR